MKPWQFSLAYIVALILLAFLTVAPYFGLEATPNPLVVSGLGALLGYVFTRRDRLTKRNDNDSGDTDG